MGSTTRLTFSARAATYLATAFGSRVRFGYLDISGLPSDWLGNHIDDERLTQIAQTFTSSEGYYLFCKGTLVGFFPARESAATGLEWPDAVKLAFREVVKARPIDELNDDPMIALFDRLMST